MLYFSIRGVVTNTLINKKQNLLVLNSQENIPLFVCVCVCYRKLDHGVCPNYEVVDLQPRTVTPKDLASVAYD